MASTVGDVADWATIVALVAGLGVFAADFWWRRELRSRELMRGLIGPGAEKMMKEVRQAQSELGIERVGAEALTPEQRAERIATWKVLLDDIYGRRDRGDPRIEHLNTIVVFHNQLEEIADGYLSWFASRRFVRSVLDRRLVEDERNFEGFYLWFIARDANLDPPKEHGYRKIQRLVALVVVKSES